MRAIAILGLLMCSVSASAQNLSLYGGAAIGAFTYDNPGGGAFSDTVRSWKVYGGTQISNYFGLEVGRGATKALTGGDFGSPLTVDVRRMDVAHRVDFTFTTFKAMGYLPFDWGVLWLGYGVFLMDSNVDLTHGAFGRTTLSISDEDEMAAFGIEWRLRRFDRSIDLRLEYEWLSFPFANASTVSLGVAYRFGGL